MKLLMISGDRSMLQGKKGAFWYTLEAFAKEWDRVDVIVPRAAGLKTEAPSFFGNVYFHPSPRGLWYQPSWIKFRGKQLAERFKHDVMTVHEYPPFYNGIGARGLSRVTGVPYVLEIHHLVGYPSGGSPAETIGRLLSHAYLPFATRMANGVRTVSKATAETLISWGVPQQKIRVVPSFYLDPAVFATLGDAPPLQYDLVFTGRLAANKGIPEIFQALKELPRVTMLVIGDGPERPRLEKLARELGIAPRVEFRGWLPTQRDVFRAMRSARILVMNSKSEGGPRVPLEAMAIGIPVIVTRVGVMPDVIVDRVNGVFTTGESTDLVEKIRAVLADDALRERMSSEGTRIVERFNREKLIANYGHFLRSFGSNHKP